MSDLFTETPAEPNANSSQEEIENYLDHLVGEGKKFQTPEELARGKYEADQFIENLKRQNQELKEDLEQASKVDQLLEEIRADKTTSTPGGGDDNPDGGSDGSSNTRSDLTEEQLRSLIEEHVSRREVERRSQSNLEQVQTALRDAFGDKAQSHLQSKAQEVGMSVDKMKELAAENPKAFYRLIGMDQPSSNQSVSVSGNRLNSEGGPVQKRNVRDAQYYRELRKNNKGRYYSAEVQQQMFNDIKEMGLDAFYGKT